MRRGSDISMSNVAAIVLRVWGIREMRTIGMGCAALALAIGLSGAASAATITTVIDFDSGNPPYDPGANSEAIVDGYSVKPTNIQSGNCDVNKCTIESGQGDQLGIERIEEPLKFDAISFWFSPTGRAANPVFDEDGNIIENYIEVTAFKGAFETTIQFYLGRSLPTFAPLATVVQDNGEGSTASATDECKLVICKNTGYLVTFTSDLFKGIDRIQWGAKDSGQSRIDSITLKREEMEVIPLPAAGWLLLAGVGGLVAMRRKKAA